jgi:DNA-binding GntR family transcriptional regulator
MGNETNNMTKKERIYLLLRDAIVNEKLKPGERLIISRIAKEYEISESPVREALQALVQDGYVTATPFAGFEVMNISLDDVRQIFEIRIQLEPFAAKQAVRYMTNVDIASLEEIINKSKKLAENNDLLGYWKLNREFHLTHYKFCNNQRLYQMIVELYSFSNRNPSYYTDVSQVWDSIKLHETLLLAISERSEAIVEKIVRDHTIESYEHLVKRFEETKSSYIKENKK